MKALMCNTYGSLDDIRISEAADPEPADNQVLVRVHATSVNYNTIAHVTGKPFLARMMGLGMGGPKYPIPGNDITGVVHSVGKKVTRFSPGDEVFADVSEHGWGAFAQFVCVPEDVLTPKPSTHSFAQAAAVPEAGLVALQALTDEGRLEKNEKVLICGASGGIGTFAVQIAKALGAEVTAVCSTRNADLIASLGADHIVDYTKEDFVGSGKRYDLILSTAGYRPLSDYRRVLQPAGTYVCTGGKMKQIFQAMLLGPFYSRKKGQRFSSFLVKPNENLGFMKELMECGKVNTVIDRCYPLAQAGEALKHYASGKAQGKVVITVA